jgi:hypothetical protein
MRTTVRMSEHTYRAAKARAAEDGRTVSELIEDAVTLFLRAASRPTSLEPLPTYGGSGALPGVDLADPNALRNAMDAGTAVDALR